MLRLKTNSEYYKPCFILTILALIFIIIGHVFQDKIQEPLTKPLIVFPNTALDWWSISHFILFGIFGFCVPNKPLSAFSIGLLFELVEDFLSSNENTKLSDCVTNPIQFWCKGIQDGYWYMNPTDPWVNLTGYIVGSAIRTTLL